MDAMISLKGVDEAIANLFKSKKTSLRFELLAAIREFYRDDEDLLCIKEIPTETLIRKVWNVGDDSTEIKEKKRKLASLKSSLNQSFKKLSENGKNPECIKIGRQNIFIISEERKNELIQTLTSSVQENDSLQNVIGAFRQVLSEVNPEIKSGDYKAALEELEKTKSMIKELAGRGETGGYGSESTERGSVETAKGIEAAVEVEGGGEQEKTEEAGLLVDGDGFGDEENIEGGAEEIVLAEDVEEEEEFSEDEELLEVQEVKEGDTDTVELVEDIEGLEEGEGGIVEGLEEVEETEGLEELEEAEDSIEGEEGVSEVQEAEATEMVSELVLADGFEGVGTSGVPDDEKLLGVGEGGAEGSLEGGGFIEGEEEGEVEAGGSVGEVEELDEFVDEEVLGKGLIPDGLEGVVEVAQVWDEPDADTVEEVQDVVELEDAEEEQEIEEETPEETEEELSAFRQILADISRKIQGGDYESALDELEKTRSKLQAFSAGGSDAQKEEAGLLVDGDGFGDEEDIEGGAEEIVLAKDVEEEEEFSEDEELLEVQEVKEGDADTVELVEDIEGLEEGEGGIVEGLEEVEETEGLEELEEAEDSIEGEEGVSEVQEAEATEMVSELVLADGFEGVGTSGVPDDEELLGVGEGGAEGSLEEGGFIEGEEEFSEDEELLEVEEVEETEDLEETEGIQEYNNAEEMEGVRDLQETQVIDEDVEELPSEGIPSDENVSRDDLLNARVLAERFESYLDITKRLYNRHIWIPGNCYVVGDRNPRRDEQRETRITLRPFYLGEYLVTNAIFRIFVEKTGYKTSAEKTGYGEVYGGGTKRIVDRDTGRKSYIMTKGVVCKTVEGACWRHPFGPGSSIEGKDNHPVTQVSIDDVRAFAAWTGKRLPTEAEWEAAARGADGRIFPWGNDWRGEYCNFEESCIADTTSVDCYQDLSRSPLGICDLSGNVMEWTSTIYEDSSGRDSSGERYYIMKGGSFVHKGIISPSRRFKVSEKSWSNITGFRCAA